MDLLVRGRQVSSPTRARQDCRSNGRRGAFVRHGLTALLPRKSVEAATGGNAVARRAREFVRRNLSRAQRLAPNLDPPAPQSKSDALPLFPAARANQVGEIDGRTER